MRTLTQQQQNITLRLLALLLLTYTVIRAAVLSITWDEAYTYIEFVRNGVILPGKYEMMSANNHILNTIGMILFSKMFGVSEFALRIPNVIAHFIFLFYSAKLVRKIDQPLLVICAFVILNVNPYMLDFFCLARGYGLSLGMMMASIYYLSAFCSEEDQQKTKNAFVAMLFAALAVLSNFVLLNYFVVLFGLIFLTFIYFAATKALWRGERFSFFIKGTLPSLILLCVLLWFVIPVTFKLKEAGALFFGGERSFWSDTISTIVDRSFYELGYNYWFQRIAKAIVFIVLIGATIYTLITPVKKASRGKALFLTTLILLIGLCSLSTIIQHHLMGTPYLLDRTVLFLVVLFSLIFVFFLAELLQLKKAVLFIGLISAAFLLFHFFMTFNFQYVLEWKYDADTKQMLADLNEQKTIPVGKETISIGIPLTFDPAINFYREKDDLTWLNTAWRNESYNMCHDYFYLTREEAEEHKDSITVLKTYPRFGNVLAKPKYGQKEIKEIVKQEKDFSTPFEFNEKAEYGPTFSIVVNDSLMPQKRGVLEFTAEVKAPDPSDQNLIMVISLQNARAEVYSWQKAYLKDFIKENELWNYAQFTCVVPPETRAGDEIKCYIWNPEKQALVVRKQGFRWLGYKF